MSWHCFHSLRSALTYHAVKKAGSCEYLRRNLLRSAAVISAVSQLLFATQTYGGGKPLEISAIVSTDHPVNRCVPTQAFGAGIDGHDAGECARMFTDRNTAEML